MEMGRSQGDESDDDDGTVCLGESFFINQDYQLTRFTFGSQVLQLLCLQSASTDFDLTGQLVWPGARLLNDYLSLNSQILKGSSIIELGSGVGITGILCSRFCGQVMLTDHNDEVLKILKKNIELQESSESSNPCASLFAEKLEWGNSSQLNEILQKRPGGYDLVLGADICSLKFHPLSLVLWNSAKKRSSGVSGIAPSGTELENLRLITTLWHGSPVCSRSFQQNNIPLLFDTVEQLLRGHGEGLCKFILAYVSRTKVMDVMVPEEAIRHGLNIKEIAGTRSVVAGLEGVIYEIIL